MSRGFQKSSLQALIQLEAVKCGLFTLTSGVKSDVYLDLRKITLNPAGLYCISVLTTDLIQDLDYTAIGGLTMGADPIVSSLGLYQFKEKEDKIPKLFVVRKEPKKHGTAQYIEGMEIGQKDRVILVDDVLTSGKSLLTAADRIIAETGCQVVGACVVVDRLEGGIEKLAEANIPVRSIFTIHDFKTVGTARLNCTYCGKEKLREEMYYDEKEKEWMCQDCVGECSACGKKTSRKMLEFNGNKCWNCS